METAAKWGLGIGAGVATLLLYVTRNVAKAATFQPTPSPAPAPSPEPLTAGALAQKGDTVEVPVSYLYARGVPFDPNRGRQLQPNQHLDTVFVEVTEAVPYPHAPGEDLRGVTTGFTFSGPSSSGSSSIPERIPTPLFSRGAVQSLIRNGQRVA